MEIDQSKCDQGIHFIDINPLPLPLPSHPLFACLGSRSFFMIFEEADRKNWKKPIWLNSFCDIQDYAGPQGARWGRQMCHIIWQNLSIPLIPLWVSLEDFKINYIFNEELVFLWNVITYQEVAQLFLGSTANKDSKLLRISTLSISLLLLFTSLVFHTSRFQVCLQDNRVTLLYGFFRKNIFKDFCPIPLKKNNLPR